MNSTFILDEWSFREQKVMELLKIDKKLVDPKEDLSLQNHLRVQTFIEPFEGKLKEMTMLELKLGDLRKITSDRHQYARQLIPSVG
jgi:hypothetical protein